MDRRNRQMNELVIDQASKEVEEEVELTTGQIRLTIDYQWSNLSYLKEEKEKI